MLSQGPAFLPTAATRAPPSTSCALHRGVLAPRKQGSPRQSDASHSMCQTLQSPARPHLSACPGTGVGCSGTAEKRVKDQLGAGGCSHAWLPALGARLRPRPGVMPAAPARARPQQQHGAMASAPQHAGACPHDRLLIEPGYILILLPAKGFSWRHLPAGCPDFSTLPVAGRTGTGLPAAGTASGATLGHSGGGAARTRARWKHLLEHAAPLALGFPGKSWLPALWLKRAAISGSPLGRGGPGDRVGPGNQFPSIGKKGRAKPSLGSPAGCSTAAWHRNLSSGLLNPLLHGRAATSTGLSRPSNEDTH